MLTKFERPPRTTPSAEAAPVIQTVVKLLQDASLALADNAPALRLRIAQAVALLTKASGQDRPCTRGGLAPWQARQVQSYIEAHLSEALLIEDLRAITRFSPSHFSRAFRSTFGETPHAYLTQHRIERASALMLTTDEPLSQIAVTCGFCDQAHLSRLFRRVIGISPALWRRQMQNAPVPAQAA